MRLVEPHGKSCDNNHMDLVHRKPESKDFRLGRDCQFCSQADPDFHQRKTIDRLVHPRMDDIAGAHLTEEGYVKHRLAELRKKSVQFPALLMRSA